jgi:hypothetical protein
MIKDERLDFWIKHNYNVLFIGKHGVGKTSIIKAAFERHKLKWRYFSASTMDPWVDFIGIPKERQASDGTSYIDLLRPQEFQRDEVEALFFDEFNRSHKKVRNAVMELIQFRSINGKKFNNLKMIWAAINPQDEGQYDVEQLDWAQQDRFPIQIYIPYKCHRPFFVEKFTPEIAKAAISWWDELPPQIKDKVSPRRLNDALMVYEQKGDMRDVLPEDSNVPKLYSVLQTGPISDRLKALYKAKDTVEGKKFLATENSFTASEGYILKTPEYLSFFLPLYPKEKLAAAMARHDSVSDFVMNNVASDPVFQNLLVDIHTAGTNKKICKAIARVAKTNKYLQNLIYGSPTVKALKPMTAQVGTVFGSDPAPVYHGCNNNPNYMTDVVGATNSIGAAQQTYSRSRTYFDLIGKIPFKLSTAEADKTFEFLNAVAARSWPKTLPKFQHFMGCFNHCVAQVAVNEKINWTEIDKRYSARYPELFAAIRENDYLAKKVFAPA